MADATAAELRTRIAEKLFILVAGETVESEDAATIDKVAVSVNEKLREDEIAYWSDSAIPQHVLEDLAAYIACHLANDYMPANEAAAFRQDHMDRSKMALRALTATKKKVTTPTRGTYF